MLMVTHACNLSCAYCYERFKSGATMSYDTARTALELEFAKAASDADATGLEIDFMGGEPLLAFPLIRQIVEELEASPPPVPFICFATTNGTILDAEMKVWFERHCRTMWLGASVDGTEAAQRTNRGEAAAGIDLGWFRRTRPAQEFHMTVYRESLPHLADGVMRLLEDGHSVNASLAQGTGWDGPDAKEFSAQLRRLAEWFLADGARFRPLNLLAREVVLADDDAPAAPRWCGSGREMTTYDVDGTAYGCHLFTPLVLGGKALSLAEAAETPCEEPDPFCARCILRLYCPTCAGFNHKDRGASNRRDRRGCRMVLANAKEAAEFQVRRLAREPALCTEADVRVAKSALRAVAAISGLDEAHAEFPLEPAPAVRNRTLEPQTRHTP